MRLAVNIALLSGVCYALYFRLAPDDGTVIEVSPGAIDAIVERQESLLERPLTVDERAAVTRDYIEEEILVREAFRRGLQRTDAGVRPLVVDHARRRILENASYLPPAPTEDELRGFFDANRNRYRIPERVDLEQVSFLSGSIPTAPENVLAELRGGVDYRTFGTAGGGTTEVKEVTRSRIAVAFGIEIAAKIFSLPPGEWHGPFVSTGRTQWIRVTKRWPSLEASFGGVEADVQRDFLDAAADRAVAAELVRVRRRYRVDVEDADP